LPDSGVFAYICREGPTGVFQIEGGKENYGALPQFKRLMSNIQTHTAHGTGNHPPLPLLNPEQNAKYLHHAIEEKVI
jgi:hypothetical protein